MKKESALFRTPAPSPAPTACDGLFKQAGSSARRRSRDDRYGRRSPLTSSRRVGSLADGESWADTARKPADHRRAARNMIKALDEVRPPGGSDQPRGHGRGIPGD
jgi:hypothetical protein